MEMSRIPYLGERTDLTNFSKTHYTNLAAFLEISMPKHLQVLRTLGARFLSLEYSRRFHNGWLIQFHF